VKEGHFTGNDRTVYYIVALAMELITGHYIKFRENGKIPRPDSKLCGPWKTVGPTNDGHIVLQHIALKSLTTSTSA